MASCPAKLSQLVYIVSVTHKEKQETSIVSAHSSLTGAEDASQLYPSTHYEIKITALELEP